MSEDKASRQNTLERFVPILIFLSVVVAFLIGILWQKVSNLEKGKNKTEKEQVVSETPVTEKAKITIKQIKDLFNQDLIKFGDAQRNVLLVEISDPSCPYCHIAAGKNPQLNREIDPGGRFKLVADGGSYVAPVPEFKKLVDQKKASFVYIYSPGHGNGEMGTKALYCAYEVDKFWPVHDLLMTKTGYDLLNNEVKNDQKQAGKLADFLKSAVDVQKLKTCLESDKYDQRIQDDTSLARSLGVGGTPGFFVNETNFSGAYSYQDMEPIINAALK